ncbi:MAG: hypothetical protein JRF63_10855, partial [Deltaproteobacteria bacterium]|nr:hypothetical protein [Deltaproteobacteria bacterium]
MKTSFFAITIATLLATISAQALATGSLQDQDQPEAEGPPGPAETDDPEAEDEEVDEEEAETDPGDAETAPSGEDPSAAEDELAGPGEPQTPVEPDMIIGLDPSGMPVVPEREPTKYGTDDVRRGLFLIGVGIGIGIFLPRDVNDYISDWTSDQGASEQVGFSEMLMNFV